MNIEGLRSELERARTGWGSLYARLVESKYDTVSARPAISDQSVEVLNANIIFVLDGIAAILPENSRSVESNILSFKVKEILSSLDGLSANAQSALASVNQSWQPGFTINSVDINFAMNVANAENGIVASFDLANAFGQIYNAQIQLMTHLALLLPLTKAEGVGDLSVRAKALEDIVRGLHSKQKGAQEILQKVTTTADEITQHNVTALNNVTQSQTALSQIQSFQQQATTDVGTVTALVEQIKAVGTGAGSLEQQINSYQAIFDAFQKQLDSRNAEFAKFQTDQEKAKKANEGRESDIALLMQQADSMISGATTAGLAKAMEDSRQRYERRMIGARRGFYFAVAMLVLSAIPLAAHLLPNLFGSLIPAFDTKADGSLFAAIGKIVLLLPATWLTGFFTKSYADFFHLEREYAHKAALAMSVDGFKRQAPKYEEEITAEVFLEIRNNPAKGKAVETASHPLYDVLAKVVGKALDRDKKSIT